MGFSRAALSVVFAMTSFAALAADYPAPKQGDWTARDFKFHTGETMPELRLHYTTVGDPTGQPVAGAAWLGRLGGEHADRRPSPANCSAPASRSMRRNITSSFPTAVGHGKSSKPSDAMKTAFPKYDYADMVDAQYRLLTEGLGIKHLRLVIGNSMGGMQTWLWGEKYPDYHGRAGADGVAADRDGGAQLDAAADDARDHPQRSRLQRRQLHHAAAHDEIRHRRLPLRLGRRHAAYQMLAPTARRPTRWSSIGSRSRSPLMPTISSISGTPRVTYDAAPGLEKIEAVVLAINSADDERNPPETGVTDAAIKRIKNGKIYLIPASTETRGHLTTGNAKFYAEQLHELLQTAPQRTRS